MSRLSDAYDRDGRSRSVIWTVCLLTGSLFAAVGTVATAASLIVGLGVSEPAAFRVAALLGGALPLTVFLLPQLTDPRGSHSLALAGAGVLVGVASLGLFWTTLPVGWTGRLAGLSPVALGTYAVGLVAAVGARLVSNGGSERARRQRGDRASGTERSDGGSDASRRGANALGGVDSAVGPVDEERNHRDDATDATSGGDSTGISAMRDGGEDDDVEFFDDEET